MKKRVLSMLLAFILCFSTLPMTAFAQEADAVAEQEEQQETDSAAEQEEAEAAAAPGEETPADKSTTAATPGTEDSTAGEAPDTVEPSVESVSDSDAGTQDTSADDEKKAAVQKVQALIDALPDEVTVENAESVGAQLEAIDEAMESLTKEQIAELDMTRLHAISEALNTPMTVPMTIPGLSKLQRYMDDIVIFASNKKILHRTIVEIMKMLGQRFRLKLKHNYQVCKLYYEKGKRKIGRALDFMGFIFYRNKTLIRKNIMLSATRLAKKMERSKEANRGYFHRHIEAMLSYMGWFTCTDTYDCYQSRIKPYIHVGRLKKNNIKNQKEAEP